MIAYIYYILFPFFVIIPIIALTFFAFIIILKQSNQEPIFLSIENNLIHQKEV